LSRFAYCLFALVLAFFQGPAYSQPTNGGYRYVPVDMSITLVVVSRPWTTVFNPTWQQSMQLQMPAVYASYQNIIGNTSLTHLRDFQNRLHELSFNPNLKHLATPEALTLVNATIYSMESYERLSKVHFGSAANFKPLANEIEQAQALNSHLQKIRSDFPAIANSQLVYSLPYSSTMGQQLYSLQEQVLRDGARQGVRMSHLWLVDEVYKQRQAEKADLLIRDITKAMAPFEDYDARYVKEAYRDYVVSSSLTRPAATAVLERIAENNRDALYSKDQEKNIQIKDEDAQALADAILPAGADAAIRAEVQASLPAAVLVYALRNEVRTVTKELGAYAYESKAFVDLSTANLDPAYSSENDVRAVSGDIRRAGNFLEDKVEGRPEGDPARVTFEESRRLQDQGESALKDGDIASSAAYMEASRYGTLVSTLQVGGRIGLGFVPIAGDVADFYELSTGLDAVSGKQLSGLERVLAGVGLVIGSRALWSGALKYGGEFVQSIKGYVNAGAESHLKFSKGLTSPSYNYFSKSAFLARHSDEAVKAVPISNAGLYGDVEKSFSKTLENATGKNMDGFFEATGVAPDLARPRLQVATDFYETLPSFKGNSVDIGKQLVGIDFSKPVGLLEVRKGERFIAWDVPGGELGNYLTKPGFSPSEIGIAASEGVGGVIMAKVPTVYEATEDMLVLASHANFAFDSWSFKAIANHAGTLPKEQAEKLLSYLPKSINFDGTALTKTGVDYVPGGGPQFAVDPSKFKKVED
jgi:hypothetical protein